MNSHRLCIGLILTASAVAFPALSVAAPSAAQKTAAAKVKNQIDSAARLYVAGNYAEAAAGLKEAQAGLENLASEADAELIELLKPQFNRLRKAHELLEFEGIKLPTLKPLGEGRPATPDTPKPEVAGVSFTKQVAPILVSRCGKCHVNKSSGDLSIATYEALMKGHPDAGVIIFKGDPVGSRLIEVIEGGEMPPNGSFPEPELEVLKMWITQGAKFDGDSPQTNLTRLVPGSEQPETVKVEIKPATGNETVSFARHVAPVLVQNCAGCHVNPQPQARGGLNLTTFAGLMQGGDTGTAVMAGNGAQSLLIQKLKGTAGGQQMPVGRGPLPATTIARIEKWIDEGAKFDGDNPSKTLSEIAAYARSEGSTHEQLAMDRMEQAGNFWRSAMPGIKANSVETKNFYILGNFGESTLAEFGEAAEKVVPAVAEAFQSSSDEPLIKGRLTLYFFKQRYDYSEFGKMVERRDLPQEWRGHWRFSGIDAYAAMVAPRTDQYSVEALVAQQVTGAYLASLGKTSPPRWFSEGAGRVIAARISPEDPRVVEWDESLREVLSKMNTPDDFLTGKLPPEPSDIASYSFVRYLMKDSKDFNRLVAAIKNEQNFAQAFSTIYGGSPNQLTVTWVRRAARGR